MIVTKNYIYWFVYELKRIIINNNINQIVKRKKNYNVK